VRFVLMIEAQQGLTYAEQLAIARTAESVGFGKAAKKSGYPAIYTSAEIGGKACEYVIHMTYTEPTA
jgi:hypothetical protein